jgi:hypothetical protein
MRSAGLAHLVGQVVARVTPAGDTCSQQRDARDRKRPVGAVAAEPKPAAVVLVDSFVG